MGTNKQRYPVPLRTLSWIENRVISLAKVDTPLKKLEAAIVQFGHN